MKTCQNHLNLCYGRYEIFVDGFICGSSYSDLHIQKPSDGVVAVVVVG